MGTCKRQVNRYGGYHTQGRGKFTVGTKNSLYPSGTTAGIKFSKYGYHLGLAKPTSGVLRQTIRE
jgi:hypothetical protein